MSIGEIAVPPDVVSSQLASDDSSGIVLPRPLGGLLVRRLVVVGWGQHFGEAYAPALSRLVRAGRIRVLAVVDTAGSAERVQAAMAAVGLGRVPFLVNPVSGHDPLPQNMIDQVDALSPDGIICCSPPEHRGGVYDYAIERRLPMLLDKPIIAHVDSANDPAAARRIGDDVAAIGARVQAAGDLRWEVMAQRSAMLPYRRLTELIREGARHGAGVTSFTSEHGDGQLRTREELATMDYHGFKLGFGVGQHSAFHHLHVLVEALRAGPSALRPVSVTAFASGRRPRTTVGLTEGLPLEMMLANYRPTPFVPADVSTGETDLFATYAFFDRWDHLVCHATVNTLHTSLTKRRVATTDRSNPYRGQGRLKSEHINIEQGAIQRFRIANFHSPDDEHVHRSPVLIADRHSDLFDDAHLEIGDDRTTLQAKEALILNWLEGGELVAPFSGAVATSRLISLAYESVASSRSGRSTAVSGEFNL